MPKLLKQAGLSSAPAWRPPGNIITATVHPALGVEAGITEQAGGEHWWVTRFNLSQVHFTLQIGWNFFCFLVFVLSGLHTQHGAQHGA